MARIKTGGRSKGVPNKDTKALRERIADLIDANFESIQSDMDSLTPAQRLDFFIKLFEYSLPKLNRTEIETTNKTAVDLNQPKTLADWYDQNRSSK